MAMHASPGPAEPLRVLICLLYYLPHRTGYSIYVQRLAEALAARGHRVTVLCARHAPQLAAEEVRNGVRIVRLWAPVSLSRGMIMPAYPFVLSRLVAEADVVLANTPMAETAVVAWAASRHRRPVVAVHHGDLILPPGALNRAITAVMFALYRRLARRAFRLVACNEDYARTSYYLSPFAAKVRYIQPPVVLPAPDPVRARALRRAWAPDGGPVIGYSGRFVAEKRPDLLLEALAHLAPQHPRLKVVFAGQYDIPYEGTWRQHRALVERWRPHLVFLGSLPDPQAMADFYAALDVLVLPSDSDSFALVQAEAMLCGTPVVATDTPGARMAVIQTGMGRIVPRGDAAALAGAVADVVVHAAKYRKPAELVRRTFDFTATVEAYERLFEEAVRSSPRL